MALTQLARAYQALGQYRKAEQNLTLALELARKAEDQVQIATILGSLGGSPLSVTLLMPPNKRYRKACVWRAHSAILPSWLPC